MRALSFAHASAVDLLGEQMTAFVEAAETFSGYDLLGASRVHGWSRLDVVVHVRAGLEEMVATCSARVDHEPDHDAASYWRSFADDDATADDQVPHILWLRRTAAAYPRPEGALRHLNAVVELARLALAPMPDHPVRFQRKTMTSGDFLATWVVELAVHQLDLGEAAGHPTAGALDAVRRTVEAVADVTLPEAWDDQTAALVALGRAPIPVDAAHLGDVLPISL